MEKKKLITVAFILILFYILARLAIESMFPSNLQFLVEYLTMFFVGLFAVSIVLLVINFLKGVIN